MRSAMLRLFKRFWIAEKRSRLTMYPVPWDTIQHDLFWLAFQLSLSISV